MSTDADAWEDSVDTQRRWMLWQAVPIPVLYQAYAHRFGKAAERCFRETGAPMARNHLVRIVNGYWYLGAGDVDEAAIAERHRVHCARIHAYIDQGTTLYEQELRPQIEASLAELRRSRPRSHDIGGLADHLDRAMDVAADAFGDLHWRPLTLEQWDWPATYHEITGRPLSEARILLAGLGHATSRLIASLRRAARTQGADRDRHVAALLRTHGRRTGYGFGSFVHYDTPTWAMRPDRLRALVEAYERADLNRLDHAERRAKAARSTLLRSVRRALDKDGRVRFDAAYVRAANQAREMENSNRLIEQECMGTLREAVHAVGSRLVKAGAISDADDAYHLTLAELRDLPADPRALVARRSAALDHQATLEAPPVIGGSRTASAATASTRSATDDNIASDGVVLRGTGVSPGSATGRACVAAATSIPPDVVDGDILVASDVGPAWTPILPLVRALVLDGGAPDQHAAIVAREFGIPTIIQTRRATTSIEDRACVFVDADAGTVAVLPEL